MSAALVLAAGLSGWGCHQEGSPAANAAPAAKADAGKVVLGSDSEQLGGIKVEAAKSCNLCAVHLPGRVTWNESATVRVFSPFGGRVTKLGAEPGEPVETGAILASIASPDFGQAQADARRSATDLVLAGKNATRLHDLKDHGAATERDVQAADADLSRAQAENERAQARLAQFGDVSGNIDGSFLLRAPRGGILVERNVATGQEVRADQMLAGIDRLAAPLFVVTDPARLWVWIDVSEADLGKVQKGQTVTVRSQVFPDRIFAATIDYISDGLDPITRTAKARAVVDNKNRLLKSEMLVWADLSTATTAALDVNSRAVFLKGDRHYVYTEESRGAFARREVVVGVEHDGLVQVLGGLKVGDRVVADGALLLDLVADGAGRG
ncbi:MAG TPA: efflux RND transporter periplasmic adaptor subunit [Candidatus Limnocylindria bacterium]|nr:efflux RND transporter periplasmic adaptor subunit [Candidatus Limnocylindria bacterium]